MTLGFFDPISEALERSRLRELQPQLSDGEQAQVAVAAARALARQDRIAVLTVRGATRAAGGVRAFVSEAEAREWLQAP